MITLKCPYCEYDHDISNLVAGNRIYCVFCTAWLMLAFSRNGSAYFVKVQPPVSYPREKR